MAGETGTAIAQGIEQSFLANKPLPKKVFFRLIKQLPQFYRAYDFDEPDARGRFFYLTYLYMRAIDDLVDGDNNPIQFENMAGSEQYLLDQQKQYIESLKNGTPPQSTDNLLLPLLQNIDESANDAKFHTTLNFYNF